MAAVAVLMCYGFPEPDKPLLQPTMYEKIVFFKIAGVVEIIAKGLVKVQDQVQLVFPAPGYHVAHILVAVRSFHSFFGFQYFMVYRKTDVIKSPFLDLPYVIFSYKTPVMFLGMNAL